MEIGDSIVEVDDVGHHVYISLTNQPLEPGRDSVMSEVPMGSGWIVLDWKDGKLVGIDVPEGYERLDVAFLRSLRPGSP